ncbi:hypothetical protein LAZ67_22000946 [Cordylochernes scorpioides]|uniref:Reverse transcriptase domain-containing protein n=1 Tax=Cordylochernes scorpioides TaxID=51811 RepID=A0ABY6LNX8_9ARAC|nr:hypothetical protein LAZ67_22000946 [Cordylochernes scorpioides]
MAAVVRWEGSFAEPIRIRSGVLQGVPLSPYLFILFNNDLISTYNGSDLPAVLLYAAPIWACDQKELLDKTQDVFLRRLLNLPRYTPGYILRMECGRTSLAVTSIKLTMKYWIRILNMEANRLPFICLTELMNLSRNSNIHIGLVETINDILNSTGFSYLINCTDKDFLQHELPLIIRTAIDQSIQGDWARINNTKLYPHYRNLKKTSLPEGFLLDNLPFIVKRHIAQKTSTLHILPGKITKTFSEKRNCYNFVHTPFEGYILGYTWAGLKADAGKHPESCPVTPFDHKPRSELRIGVPLQPLSPIALKIYFRLPQENYVISIQKQVDLSKTRKANTRFSICELSGGIYTKIKQAVGNSGIEFCFRNIAIQNRSTSTLWKKTSTLEGPGPGDERVLHRFSEPNLDKVAIDSQLCRRQDGKGVVLKAGPAEDPSLQVRGPPYDVEGLSDERPDGTAAPVTVAEAGQEGPTEAGWAGWGRAWRANLRAASASWPE